MSEPVLQIVEANVREPVQVKGDLYSLAACNEIGCRRLADMMREFDLASLDRLAGFIMENSREVLALMYRVMHSRLGRTLRSIRQNEPLAQSHGINPLAYRLFAIGLSAWVSGMVGGIFVFHLTIVDLSIFDFYYLESMLIMVVVGGPGSFWRVLGASVVFSALPDLLRFGADLRLVLFGVVLIASILLLPGGVAGYMYRRRLRRWRAQ